MGMRAADDLQVEQSLEGVVVEERRTPGDMAGHVLPLQALADDVEIVVALVGEDVLADSSIAGLLQARRSSRAPRPTGSPR